MSTARNGIERATKFLGSDLSGMHQAPEGVDQLMEDWRQTAGVQQLHYRIVTREVGAGTMKRLTARGVKNGGFLEVRVNPDCGGNDNCWLASVVLKDANDEKSLRRAADAINDRTPERKTPMPPQPKAAPVDPFADLTLDQLAAKRAEHDEVQRQAAQNVQLMEQNISQLDGQMAEIEQEISTLEANLQKQRNMLATRKENRKESERTLDQSRQKSIAIGKQIAKIDAAIAVKTKEAAKEIAAPMRSLLEEEAKKRGISFEAVLAELSSV